MSIVDATDDILSNSNAEIVEPPYISSASTMNDPTSRLYSRQLLSGNMRGNQNVTGTFTVTDPTSGSIIGIGNIPDNSGDFGFFLQDASGNLLFKMVGSTMYTYDITQSPTTNNLQLLKLPDGTYGMVVAKPGENVSGIYA